jgi:threonylcarbamoyladenosine tRNA methylthiotransferase MtaB
VVVEQIKRLVDKGFNEVVLTGEDLTSWGADLPATPRLGDLVLRILRLVPDLPRLRISSIDSIEADDALMQAIATEPRLMPHLHLSLQAGDDMILKRMKRRHSRAQAVEAVARLKERRPEIAIGADLIAGFPTETDAMAENSLRLIDDCDIVMGHIFPFSPRAGTPAARMPQVPPPVVRERARRLREAGARRKAGWLQGLAGSRQQVLVEREDGSGHCANFAPIRIESGAEPGTIVDARVRASTDSGLIGDAA